MIGQGGLPPNAHNRSLFLHTEAEGGGEDGLNGKCNHAILERPPNDHKVYILGPEVRYDYYVAV